MKIDILQGKIRLERLVIDFSKFQIRPKISEQDLERYYDSFVEHVQEIGDYFEDGAAFNRAVAAVGDKRPKLVARETRYPLFWAFDGLLDFLKPSTRRLNDHYFVTAHSLTMIPGKGNQDKNTEKPLDEKLGEDLVKKFKQYPGYECIIEIPNDRTPAEAKSSTFHEAVHYVLHRYCVEGRRNLVDAFINRQLTPLERYQNEHLVNENVTKILTDKLLCHDPDAQFENRWLNYSLHDGLHQLAGIVSAATTGIVIAGSISNPYLIPLVVVPGRIKDYALLRYKQSRRGELLKAAEYPRFKI